MKFDFCGHDGHAVGQLVDYDDLDRWTKDRFDAGRERTKAIQEMMAAKGVDPKDLDLEADDFGLMMEHQSCGECGKYYNWTLKDGVVTADTTCAHPGGVQKYAVNIAIPSGKIVFANDLRDLIVVEDPGLSVNSTLGQKLLTEAYATAGMAHIFVGNTCPSVFRMGDDLVVGMMSEPDEDADLTDEEYEAIEKANTERRLGWICTDLWWFSAMDHDRFLALCKAEDCDPTEYSYFIAHVEPGVYAFTDLLGRRDDEEFFSIIRKTDEPAVPIVEFDGTPASSLKESRLWNAIKPGNGYLRQYPYLRMEYLFFTLGNGLRWVNGHPLDVSRCDAEPFKKLVEVSAIDGSDDFVPVWDDFTLGKGHKIYPLGKSVPSVIGRAPLDIEPYWLAAGMMFCKSALRDAKWFFDEAGYDRIEQQQVMRDTLQYLIDIAHERGLVEDGTLARIFEELRDPSLSLANGLGDLA